jgi:type I restriction enzyme M protein
MFKQQAKAQELAKNGPVKKEEDLVEIKELLLENCNLHTVLDLPSGVFSGAGVKTVVLFFEKGKSTQKVWYYQLNLDRNLGKTNPLNENDLAQFVELQKTKANSNDSWTLDIAKIDKETFDLSVKNPNKGEEKIFREPKEILEEMAELDEKNRNIIKNIKDVL